MTIETDEMRVEIDATTTMQEAVFNKIIAFFTQHGCWSGESVMQCDAPQLEAAPLLADLVDDILKPAVTYKDE